MKEFSMICIPLSKPLLFALVILTVVVGCDNEDPKPAQPVADFSFDNTKGRTVQFTNASQNSTNYFFDFGDGTSFSTEDNPSHAYAKDSVYKVTLTAIGEGGLTTKTLDVQVTGIVGPNLLKGGDLETADEVHWSKLTTGQKLEDGTFAHVNYKFGAIQNLPTGATGGGFNVSNGTETGNSEVGSIFFQELTLTKGVYKFSAVMKHPSTASGLKNFWYELYLGKPKPVLNDGYNNNAIALLSGFISNTWNGKDPYAVGEGIVTKILAGLDGNTIANEDGIVTIKEDGTYYFSIKMGKGGPAGGGGFGEGGITIDNLYLGKFQ